MKPPVAVAFGVGINSTALLSGMHERGERPDVILTADTGGERPIFYAYFLTMQAWCRKVGFPVPLMVHKGGRQESLEENCLRMNMLPSIAYGFKGCSHKFKREPQDTFINNWEPAQQAWARGLKVTKLIGYDADEERRAKVTADSKYNYEYPLITWGWGRDECVAAIQRAGLPSPGKSSCFFCPSNTRSEINELKAEHPVLFQRALAMEVNAEANLTSVAGLGRRFSWHEHEDTPEAKAFAARASARYADGIAAAKERKAWAESGVEIACECYDG